MAPGMHTKALAKVFPEVDREAFDEVSCTLSMSQQPGRNECVLVEVQHQALKFRLRKLFDCPLKVSSEALEKGIEFLAWIVPFPEQREELPEPTLELEGRMLVDLFHNPFDSLVILAEFLA